MQQQGSQQAPPFRSITRQQVVETPVLTSAAFGTKSATLLGQTGYLGRLTLFFSGSYITGTGTPAGGFLSYPPAPWNAIDRVRLYTGENTSLVDVSGWGLYIYNARRNYLSSPAQDLITAYNAGNRSVMLAAPSGDASASTTYNFAGSLELPVMTDDRMMLGMLMTQNLNVQLTAEITWATAASIHNITGVSVTPSFNAHLAAEFYSVPPLAGSQPNLQFSHTLLETNMPLSANGDVIYRVPPGNTYLDIHGIVENDGAQVAAENINSVAFQYAQNQTPYKESYVAHLARLRRQLGYTLENGAFSYLFDAGWGEPGILDTRDVFNSSQQTDVQIITNLSGVSWTNGNLRVIQRQLSQV